MWFLIGFLVLVLVEIALLIQLGGMLGLWLTLAWILLTGGLGVILLKGIGSMPDGRINYSLSDFQDNKNPMAHRGLVMIAGIFLLLPGFFTDALGILLLLPPIRRMVIASIARRQAGSSASVTVITDAEWRDVTATRPSDNGDSGSPRS